MLYAKSYPRIQGDADGAWTYGAGDLLRPEEGLELVFRTPATAASALACAASALARAASLRAASCASKTRKDRDEDVWRGWKAEGVQREALAASATALNAGQPRWWTGSFSGRKVLPQTQETSSA